ncbi:MAG: SDR family oxidoreductase [Candidatus Eiseniibacteriota bacterium]|nr:MAG: SDR family oxidoreductase [Candidatus Eisenbacteria bacterium]
MTKNPYGPILITGASSGIGNRLASSLAAQGHVVYATARKDEDIARLEEIKNVIAVKLDVRSPEQIQDAHDFILNEGRGLYGLVNNAGQGGLGMFSTWTDEEMFDIFDVNVFGVHRVTNTFLHLLLEGKGRIVNIGSQGGILTKKYYGPYTMTKHALEAYTVALNEELRSQGVWVSIVQPGGIVSNVGANALEGTLARFRRAASPFEDEARQAMASFEQEPVSDEIEESEANRKPSSPEIVAEAVRDALFSAIPKLRYLVGTKWEGDRVLNALIQKLLDENDNPKHSYSRDELIALLDRQISQRRARASSFVPHERRQAEGG